MELTIIKADEQYRKQALNLNLNTYQNLRKQIPFLPSGEYYKEKLNNNIKEIFQQGLGVMAVNQDEIVGYLLGYKVKELFGKDKGIYIPSYGNAAIESNEKEIYQKMYTKAADLWVEKNCLNHAITVPACDKDVITTFFWLGFGLRCIDAIREVNDIQTDPIKQKVKIKKAKLKDIDQMDDLYRENCLYYKHSPLFMPVSNDISIDELKDWLENDNHHLWIAYKDNKIVGFMRIEPKGETIISTHPDLLNITGAYVDQRYRRQNMGIQLLEHVMNWLKKERYQLCGVDFESINITGSNFWLKYFTPYTNSLVRHIDDRLKN